ncbi:IucA/IucC family protein [Larsenimonas rhizosphaerae]|uniref:IucA/IucC family siderophore biosynthesis protein n=1 Tax=Larsenimonas rhizosphaerae TaxID=2944682 RepID=A0AA41ZPG3_9GAMM|nr:IucA/IucC family protein [Larsenimonas rhizosphaerae]MCX2524775.1 IucA/IucC family siderophore biosynthesis protein [Larsenimonas rhizosphaerae]
MNERQLFYPARAISERESTHALLNCIIREYAIPGGYLAHHWPECRHGLMVAPAEGVYPLAIHWPDGLALFITVDRCSALGAHRYLSPLYMKRPDETDWCVFSMGQHVTTLLATLTGLEGVRNDELATQISDSLETMTEIVQARHQAGSPLLDYVASEQGLWFGHPSHPAPKARHWPNDTDRDAVTPEHQAQCALYQFAVPKRGLEVVVNGLDEALIIDSVGRQHQARAGEVVISMHPVQAALFKQAPAVQALLASGTLRDLGASGRRASPTASLRTWYVDQQPFFIKGSLNLRVTNCVRKNAWYELEGTLVIDRVLQTLVAENDPALARLRLAREPAVLWWAPPEVEEGQRRWFMEQTGIILRENFCLREGRHRCVLTATLVARNVDGNALLDDFLPRHRQGGAGQYALNWFSAYLETLLAPVLVLFFRYGVVLEPHLQNCVLIHDQGQPRDMLLRDFEGIKLVDGQGTRWMDADIPGHVRDAMTYSRAQGWRRVVYCLLINHLSEAVLALSWNRPALAPALWAQVREHLVEVRSTLGETEAPELDALLDGASLPCKTNLKVRLMAGADREAGYVDLPSPWAMEVACA